MVHRGFGVVTTLLTGGLVSGCATIPRHAGFPEVAKTVEQRTGLHIQQYAGAPTGLVADTIQELLRDELTLDRAVRIAALNNRSLQATLEELGIARADLIQAGLITNPIFSGHARFPDVAGKANVEFAVTESVLDTLFIPLRRKLAGAQFEQAKLRVGDAVLSLMAKVKATYYTAQAAGQIQGMRRSVLQAAEAAAQLAERQHQAGNISALDLANQQAFYQQAQLELMQSEAQAKIARERLNQMLGVSATEASWQLAAHLPELPPTDPSLEGLEATALSQRLDLAAAQKEIEIQRRNVSMARFGLLPVSGLGVSTETESGGDRVTGPTWEVAVPVLDWNQAARARATAQLQQSQHRLAALENDIRSEVRTGHDQLLAARQATERYRDAIIPLRVRILEETQRHYNYMLLGAYDLLLAKQNEIIARREYIEALRDYWITRSELERAIGGQLPAGEPSVLSPQPTASSMTQEVPTPAHQHQHGGDSP